MTSGITESLQLQIRDNDGETAMKVSPDCMLTIQIIQFLFSNDVSSVSETAGPNITAGAPVRNLQPP